MFLSRLERYEDCFTVYRDVVKNTSDDFDVERLANLAAVSSSLNDTDLNDSNDDEASYELVYNRACALLARERFVEAEAELRRAIDACAAFLREEDESEEDIEKETAIIRVQLGYCLQMLGREKEAGALYNQVRGQFLWFLDKIYWSMFPGTRCPSLPKS